MRGDRGRRGYSGHHNHSHSHGYGHRSSSHHSGNKRYPPRNWYYLTHLNPLLFKIAPKD